LYRDALRKPGDHFFKAFADRLFQLALGEVLPAACRMDAACANGLLFWREVAAYLFGAH
jgi:hypothetical protein